VVGLRETYTGDTLCEATRQILLETIAFPEPVISVAIEPRTRADEAKMAEALQRLTDEDPTFQVKVDEDTGQTIISGMGELHLEVLVDRLLREFKVQANVGRPQVSYRETITQAARGEGRYIHQAGGRGQYGHVILELEPLPDGRGYEFTSEVSGGAIPREFVSAVDGGVQEALAGGFLAGHPMIGVRVRLTGGSYHEVDSSEIAFRIAGSLAMRNALERAGAVMMEPVMKIEVVVPEEYLGDVLGDLSARRARIAGSEPRTGGTQEVEGFVPLAEMFGYATSLRSMTQGRGNFSMEFDHYQEATPEVAERLVGYRVGF
jgi:elongation factor G